MEHKPLKLSSFSDELVLQRIVVFDDFVLWFSWFCICMVLHIIINNFSLSFVVFQIIGVLLMGCFPVLMAKDGTFAEAGFCCFLFHSFPMEMFYKIIVFPFFFWYWFFFSLQFLLCSLDGIFPFFLCIDRTFS